MNEHKNVNLWQNGPDMIIPSDSYICDKLDQPVKLRIAKGTELIKYPPISIYSMFKNTVNLRPHHSALVFKNNQCNAKFDEWHHITYFEYWELCNQAAKSFIKLGVESSECVAILGFNSPQWFISILGAIFAGGVGIGMYATNTAEVCNYIINDCKAKVFVVENKQQVEKLLFGRDKSYFKKIIQFNNSEPICDDYNGLICNWNDFMNYGNDVNHLELSKRIKNIAPNKCASLIYTSGTTGAPKAAMISHDSITYTVRYIGEICGVKEFSEKFISYLPLSHIAAQLIDIYFPLKYGITVYFASPDILKGSLNQTMREIRPTFFFGVPRVWEKIQEHIYKISQNLTGIKRRLYEWSKQQATNNILSNFNGSKKNTVSYKMAKTLILNRILKELGLDKCKHFVSGAAPISKETLNFFINLGVPLCEAYGMSETTGPHTIGTHFSSRICSIGPIREYNFSKIINENLEDGSGELCIYGRHVFMGYLNDIQNTIQSIDKDGWLHTGDIAKIDDDFLFITGRLKELIITADGENVLPIPLEDTLKAELPDLISNCMIIGDLRKYLAVLITLKSVTDSVTMEPSDYLKDNCIGYLKSIGSNSTRISEIINTKDPIVYNKIENAIKTVNEKSVNKSSKIQRFTILARDFSIRRGELGPTYKLRRPIVTKMYAFEIEELYQDSY